MLYIQNIFPFLDKSDFIKSSIESVSIKDILPLDLLGNDKRVDKSNNDINNTEVEDTDKTNTKNKNYIFSLYKISPCNVYLSNENTSTTIDILNGKYGNLIKACVFEFDYSDVANAIDVSVVDNRLSALYSLYNSYDKEYIFTDYFINACSNYVDYSKVSNKEKDIVLSEIVKSYNTYVDDTISELNEGMDLNGSGEGNKVQTIKMRDIFESEDLIAKLKAKMHKGNNAKVSLSNDTDKVYDWLDAYFKLSEGEEMKSDGREVVPLLIGPTGVFKSATVKELCKKYDYRMIDFRVAFTSRVDYSGLFQIGEIDGNKYSYACPMEELVTCSDGFREYCKEAKEKIEGILEANSYVDSVQSNGEDAVENTVELTADKRAMLTDLLAKYNEYCKTPVLFFDEISRNFDKSVEGVLTQLLNQKRFNNMTFNGCKFIAATNLNISNDPDHQQFKDDLDVLYDVDDEIDVAYANRFLPLKVYPEDVRERWFSWAESVKDKDSNDSKSNIHPLVIGFLKKHKDLVYNDAPILDDLQRGLSTTEIKAQTFPNYRTWEMVSRYLYTVDKDYDVAVIKNKGAEKSIAKTVRKSVIAGLISEKVADVFCSYLFENGYTEYTNKEHYDKITDFLHTSMNANVPVLLAGPSGLAKTGRIKSFVNREYKRTGIKPLLLNINLASKDAVDLMGYPVKETLTEYMADSDALNKRGLGFLNNELSAIAKKVAGNETYGMTDGVTVRAPDMTIKETFKKALQEGREVILLFDEVNRVSSPSVLSAVFEAVSDYRFAGVDFSDLKDKVKVVATCNLNYEGLDEVATSDDDDYEGNANSALYSGAKDIDPAFAARFAICWKKKYDYDDVQSWIDFMQGEVEEGKIDPTIVNYVKSLDKDKALSALRSVEKRSLETATPSTRNLYQLSKDIKSMRGRYDSKGNFDKSLYNGCVISTHAFINKVQEIGTTLNDSNVNVMVVLNNMVGVLREVLSKGQSWESYLINDNVTIDNTNVTAKEIISDLDSINTELNKYQLKAMSEQDMSDCLDLCKVAFTYLEALMRLDTRTTTNREKYFEFYLGETFADSFVNAFNLIFGTDLDMNISIPQLKDIKLIPTYMKKLQLSFGQLGGNTDKMIDLCLDQMREFLSVHSDTLSPKHYETFILGLIHLLPNRDNVNELMKRSDIDVQLMYSMAEKADKSFIPTMLSYFQESISKEDIEKVENMMANADNKPKTDNTDIMNDYIRNSIL